MSSAPAATGPNPLGLTPLEIASGVICNVERRWPGAEATTASPRAALEADLLPALERPPVVVAFSGGRDSSALLAVTVDVARRHGLDDPIAVTMRWDGDPASEESSWQEAVIRSIGSLQWERLRPGADLDLVGPLAQAALRSHGLLWPAPAFALGPLLRAAAGGTLLSGEGGDEVFGRWPLARVSQQLRRRQPSRRIPGAVATRLAPYPVRYRTALRRTEVYQSWLQPAAAAAHRASLAADHAVLPARWSSYLRQQAASRDLALTVRSLALLGAAQGARYSAPFIGPRFIASLGRRGGTIGLGDRSDAMRALFADLLPPEVLIRQSKASFGNVFWGEPSRDFARTWDGAGLDPALVDPDELRRVWQRRPPPYGAALPLQAAWLASSGAAPPR